MADEKFNGRTFRTDPMPAREAIALYLDIMRVAGAGVNKIPAVLAAVMAPDDRRNELADIAALQAMSEILRQTPTATIQELMNRILASAAVVSESGRYDKLTIDHFSDDLKSLFPVLKWIMTEQFSDFFSGSAGSGIIQMIKEALTPRK